MSKRSSKSARFTPATGNPVKPQLRQQGKPAKQPVKASKGKSAGVRVSERVEPAVKINMQAVKIIAAVLGVICLAGGVGVMSVTPAPYPTERIIIVVLLGFFAGLCSFAALRTERFVQSFHSLVK